MPGVRGWKERQIQWEIEEWRWCIVDPVLPHRFRIFFFFYRVFLRKKRLVRMNFHSVNGFVESLFSSDGYFLKNCGSFEKEKKFEREGNAFIILVQDQTLGTARFTNVPSPHPSPVFRLVCSRFFATSPSCSILIIDSDFNTARLCAFYIMLEQFPF